MKKKIILIIYLIIFIFGALLVGCGKVRRSKKAQADAASMKDRTYELYQYDTKCRITGDNEEFNCSYLLTLTSDGYYELIKKGEIPGWLYDNPEYYVGYGKYQKKEIVLTLEVEKMEPSDCQVDINKYPKGFNYHKATGNIYAFGSFNNAGLTDDFLRTGVLNINDAKQRELKPSLYNKVGTKDGFQVQVVKKTHKEECFDK